MPNVPLDHLKALRSDRRGGVALIFALSATVLVGLAGGGIDYARLVTRRSELQNAVDAGVLAGGNTLKLAASSQASVAGVTEQAIRDAAKPFPDRPFSVKVTVSDDKTSVFARAEETVKLTFGGLLGLRAQTVAAQARVNVVGKMRLCMLALDPGAPGAFNVQAKAQVTADGCSLYSNSTDAKGMIGGDSALARADTICSAGGFSGSKANFAPTPQTGCPAITDPLKDRAAPQVGTCTSIPVAANSKGDTSKNEIDRSIDLPEGTYCGLTIKGSAVVNLKPSATSIFVIKDKPLVVKDSATLSGDGVALYFAGDKSGLLFDKNTTISLRAPTSGTMAGLLMSEQRSVSDPVDPVLEATDVISGNSILPTPPPAGATKPMRTYRIISNNARTMLGTIYLPAGRLVIDADKPVADQSAYTVVVAQQVNLYQGPNLYLNANYDATSVPVPKGVGPLSGKLLLSQ
jgi:Flp pilus assembly protein TadG